MITNELGTLMICEFCSMKVNTIEALTLHESVCPGNPKVLKEAEKLPWTVALTEEQIAAKEAEKAKGPVQSWKDWQLIREQMYDDELKKMEDEAKQKKEEQQKKGLLNWV